MSLKEVQIEIFSKVKPSKKLLNAGALQLLSDSQARIFEDGKKSDGSKIGSYSDAYKIRRAKKGRQTNKVNLEFTGQLRNAYFVEARSDSIAVGLTGAGRDKGNNKKIVEYNEERYGNVFTPTEKELTRLEQTIADAIINLF